MAHKTFKVQAAAQLLATTVDTVRRMADRFEITVARETAGTKTRLFSLENIFAIASHRAATQAKVVRAGPIIVTTYASKAGAGSTTIASNLGVLLALRGFRVLLVDLDPDAGLTRSFGYHPDLTDADLVGTSLDRSMVIDHHFGDLLSDDHADSVVLADVLKLPYGHFGPHLVPADLQLFQLDAAQVRDECSHRNSRPSIRTFIERGRSGKNPRFDFSKYDVVLFDAPPTISGATFGVFDATDHLVSSVSVDGYFGKALQLLSRLLEGQRESHGRSPELTLVGNRFSLQRMHSIGSVASAPGALARAWLDRGIPYVDILHDSQSATAGLPLILYAPAEPGTSDVRACVESLLERFGLVSL
ncbi:AAA family ATPase [Burkholderia cenocepacia]|uniref:AAA family ATPase n=1 Tax=Burkholderia cepacia complex TaxID=87882 RepID=UPI001CF4AAFD|nr:MULTISPECIES: AAA family ATPase [Burkholderia cepacia complex]MCA7889417.1 AAA family ATPase [Burkholderia contaminans]MEB2604783.1 AAA family ATPase [Burkholderia cenocepacia]